MEASNAPLVVLVHGAWHGAWCWAALQSEFDLRGIASLAIDLPGHGASIEPYGDLYGDAAALSALLAKHERQIVLVGHSYGGAVITNVHSPNVEALVYVAAFAPAQGEPVMLNLDPIRFPGSQLLPPVLQVKVVENDPTGIAGRNLDGYIDPGRFHDVFAQDVPDATVAGMIAHQKSAALVANLEPTADPSWASTPSWAMVAQNDRVIPAAAERFMATRAGARITEVSASHAVLVSQPGAVADLVVQADQGTP